ncbi:MAG TPA: lysophospholipid acyltransferase family protein [Burkholderiales bacterium]
MSSFWRPRFWPTWIGLLLMRTLSLLPMRATWLVGAVLGELFYLVFASRRHIVCVNIERCFPELSRAASRRLARSHFRALARSILDFGTAWWGAPQRLRRQVHWHGREHYDRAIAAGRRVILLAPHVVGIEMGGLRLSIDLPIVDIFRFPHNRLMGTVALRRRSRFKALLIDHARGLVSVVTQLNAGKPLYYLPDQDLGMRNACHVPFFGIQTATVKVLGRLAAMTNATVIPCVTRQLPRGAGYEVIFMPPLSDYPTGDPLADTTRMNQAIEVAVRTCPEQYFWLHRRFKTRPEGEAPFYSV